ncbi:rCG35817 [Rattus norvegicus]|uniref:RCG35817 n=1 Tax=Rattus norvegicus TaxID=10116 RepID=A6IJK8_RAT|nr:rCG35817 [Rattus norvegicus]
MIVQQACDRLGYHCNQTEESPHDSVQGIVRRKHFRRFSSNYLKTKQQVSSL